MTDDSVRAVVRAFRILDVFREENPVLTLSEISRATGLGKTTCYRLLNTLVALEYVCRLRDGTGYQLGSRIFELGHRYLAQVDVHRAARPYLVDLAQRTEDTAFLCVLDEDEALCVDRVDGRHEVRVFILRIGGRQPVHVGAAPLALLADKTDDEIAALVSRCGLRQYTPNTIKDLKQLLAAVAQVRQQGYVLSCEDATIGVMAVGAPIFDYSNRVVASISVSGIAPRFGPDRLPGLVELVKETAHHLSADLGYLVTGAFEQGTG